MPDEWCDCQRTNRDGYPIRRGDRYRLQATYDNPTSVEQDAMAGVFVFFATADGKMPPHLPEEQAQAVRR